MSHFLCVVEHLLYPKYIYIFFCLTFSLNFYYLWLLKIYYSNCKYNKILHMSRLWYKLLVQKNPSIYKNYQRMNLSLTLPLHSELFEFCDENFVIVK